MMDSIEPYVSEMMVGDQKITVTELPWGFPRREGNPTACVRRIAEQQGVHAELWSDFYVGYVKLPAANDPSPAITVQLTCDGKCELDQPCCPKIVQYNSDGQVIAEVYADENYTPPMAQTSDAVEPTEAPDDTPKRGWWQRLMAKMAG